MERKLHPGHGDALPPGVLDVVPDYVVARAKALFVRRPRPGRPVTPLASPLLAWNDVPEPGGGID